MDLFEASLLIKSVNSWAKPLKIYQDTMRMHEDARRWCPFANFSDKISRWQHNDISLPVLNSFRQFNDEVTARPALREYREGTLEVSMIRLDGGHEIGIIGDRNIFQPILQHTMELRISINKSMIPRDLPIAETVAFSLVYADAVLAVVWAFLPNSQPMTYELLVIRVQNQFFRNLRITRITTTLDGGLYEALRHHFPNIPKHINFSDHAQEMILASNGLGINLQDEAVQTVLTKLIAGSTSENILESFGKLASFLTHDMLQSTGRLFDYYRDSWINGVTTEIFSFYRDEQSLMEPEKSPWFILGNHLRSTNHGMFAWMKGLIHYHEQTHADIQSLLQRRRFTVTPRLKPVIRLPSLREAWNARENFNNYNSPEFLATVSVLIREMVADLIYQNIGEVSSIQLIRGSNRENNLVELAIGNRPDRRQLLRQIPLHEINGRNFDRPRRAMDLDDDDTWSLPGSDQELDTDDEIDIAAQAAEIPLNADDQVVRREIQGGEEAAGDIQGGGQAVGEVQVEEVAAQEVQGEQGAVQGDQIEDEAAQEVLGEEEAAQGVAIEEEAAGEVQVGEEVRGDIQGAEEAERVADHMAIVDAPAPAPAFEEQMDLEAVENGIPVPGFDTECSICRDRQIDSVFVSCGHVVCGQCAGEIRANAAQSRTRFRCPYCSRTVGDVIPVFIPRIE